MAGFAYDNDSGKLKGGTDDTLIGNVNDSLKVAQQGTAIVSTVEPATFVAAAQSVAIGLNKSMLSLVNTSDSTVTVRILSIDLINVQTTAVTGVIASFSMFRIANHSAGTLVSTASMLTSDSLNASVTARTGSTVTSEATVPLKRIFWSSDEWGVGSQDTESSQNIAQYSVPFWNTSLKGKRLTLLANEGITIKQTVNSTAGTFDVSVLFSQE